MFTESSIEESIQGRRTGERRKWAQYFEDEKTVSVDSLRPLFIPLALDNKPLSC